MLPIAKDSLIGVEAFVRKQNMKENTAHVQYYPGKWSPKSYFGKASKVYESNGVKQ